MGQPYGVGAVAANGKLVFLPLDSVSVTAFLLDVSALVVVTQKYLTTASNGDLTNARYLYPIPEGASVCAFKMELSNGSVVSGVVKDTEKAKKIFQDAVSQGEWAGLAYEITADVFAISVGAIPAGQNVKVKITYATTVPDDESDLLNQIRFAIPTFIGNKRYGDAPQELSEERSSDASATLSFKATVQLTSKIVGITSPSHDIDVGPSKKIQSKPAPLYSTTVELRNPAPFDRDLVLSIQAEKLDKPRCVGEVDEKAQTVALSLTTVPRFDAPVVESQEYVFLIDRSYSMQDEYRMDYAKDALHHLIKGLPTEKTFFNIVSFGSGYSSLWSKSAVYERGTVQQAEKHVDTMSADMGGTVIGQVLDWIFKNRVRSVPTAVIVLTDGDVWHPEEVISLVRDAVQNASSDSFLRVFSLGIGAGASTALCEGIARTGKGVCYMTTKSEEIKERSNKLLLAARTLPYGSASGITIDWGYDTVARAQAKTQTTKPEQSKKKKTNLFSKKYDPLAATKKGTGTKFVLPPIPGVLQAPPRVPNLYPGNRFLVSAILTNTVEIPQSVTLLGELPDGSEVELPIKVAYTIAKPDERPPLLHTLSAHRIIRTLEDGDVSAFGLDDGGDQSLHDEMVQVAVVEYGTRYSLASRFTSFVAVKDIDKDNEDDDDEDDDDDDEDDDDDDDEDDSEDEDVDRNRKIPAQSFASNHIPNSNAMAAPPRLFAQAPPAPVRDTISGQVIVGIDAVSAVARLQEHDGSFALDDRLLGLLQNAKKTITLPELKDHMPTTLCSMESIATRPDLERVWATALASAYMIIVLRDRRSIWEGLWEKAREYACKKTQTASFMFNQLVQKASELLQH